MIVNSAHDFGFVHAAKCGGATVRAQIRDMDDFGGRFFRMIDHPTLGRLNGNHLPMAVLEAHFPDAYAALRRVRSYMLCRDPMERFVSAVSQWLRSERGRQPADLSPEEVHAVARELIGALGAAPPPTRPDLVYFVPQTAYATLRGAPAVDEVIPLERIDRLFDAFAERHGIELVRDSVWNPTVTYRVGWLAPALHRARDAAQRTLPVAAYARLRDVGLAVFTRRGAPNFAATLREAPGLRAFVADHYAADAELHRAALAAADADAARLPTPDTIQRVDHAD